MIHLVCYDIATANKHDHARLRRVAKFLERHGVRVQKSVFELAVDDELFRYVRASLLDMIDIKRDSLLFYDIHGAKHTVIEYHGARGEDDLFPRLII